MDDKLNKINRELKVYINESGFISNKCRNKIIKLFADEFCVNLDIDNYKNVDLSITDDFKVSYRDDLYTSSDNINSIGEVIERYERFKEKADKILKRKEIDFNNMSNAKNISNLIIVICIILGGIAITILGISAIFRGELFDVLWLVFIIGPAIISKVRDNIANRFIQARNFVKHLFKKIK